MPTTTRQLKSALRELSVSASTSAVAVAAADRPTVVAAATAVVAVAESVNAKHALKSLKAKGSYFHSGGGSLAISHKTYRPHKPYPYPYPHPHPHPPCRLSDFAIIHDLRVICVHLCLCGT